MKNFSDMLSKAKAMQMREVQDQIKKIEVEGDPAETGQSYIKGDYELKSIIISEMLKKKVKK